MNDFEGVRNMLTNRSMLHSTGWNRPALSGMKNSDIRKYVIIPGSAPDASKVQFEFTYDGVLLSISVIP
jgi:hypothetical protein